LTWEDKELVLRLLFAKINGKESKVHNTLRSRNSPTKDMLMMERFDDKEQPVFISEGKGTLEADASRASFESSFMLPNIGDDSATAIPMNSGDEQNYQKNMSSKVNNEFEFSDDIFGETSELV
jgi:hypothetical protein